MRALFAAFLVVMMVVAVARGDRADFVSTSKRQCSSEPPPVQPKLLGRPAPRNSAIVDAVGPGTWCHGFWDLRQTETSVTITHTPNAEVQSCGTCSLRFTIYGLPRGNRWLAFPAGGSVNVNVR